MVGGGDGSRMKGNRNRQRSESARRAVFCATRSHSGLRAQASRVSSMAPAKYRSCTARMAVSWDTPGDSGEKGRIRGQKGSYYGKYEGPSAEDLPATSRPPLPPGVQPGGHGGSHGQLTNEFVTAILQDRVPLVDIAQSLNMTVAGIVAHQSALKDGELLKIPQYTI